MIRNLKIMAGYFLLIFLFLSCIRTSKKIKRKSDTSLNHNTIVLNDWQKDSLGCLKIRSKKLSEYLLKKYNLEKGTINGFQYIFGKANKKVVNEDTVILIYYFDSFCKNNRLDFERDYCTAEYYFIYDTLSKVSYICI